MVSHGGATTDIGLVTTKKPPHQHTATGMLFMFSGHWRHSFIQRFFWDCEGLTLNDSNTTKRAINWREKSGGGGGKLFHFILVL